MTALFVVLARDADAVAQYVGEGLFAGTIEAVHSVRDADIGTALRMDSMGKMMELFKRENRRLA